MDREEDEVEHGDEAEAEAEAEAEGVSTQRRLMGNAWGQVEKSDSSKKASARILGLI